MTVDLTRFTEGDDVIAEVRGTVQMIGRSAYLSVGGVRFPLAAVSAARHVPPEILVRSPYVDRRGVAYIGFDSRNVYRLDDPNVTPISAHLVPGLRPAEIRAVVPA